MNTANQCIFSLNFCHGNLKNRMRMDWGMVVTRLANLDCLQPLTSYSYHPHYRMTKNIYSFIICHRCMCILYVCMPLQYFLWQKKAESFVSHLTVEYLKFEEGQKKKKNQPTPPPQKKSHRNVMLCRIALKYYRLLKIRLLRREKDTHSSVWHPECYH